MRFPFSERGCPRIAFASSKRIRRQARSLNEEGECVNDRGAEILISLMLFVSIFMLVRYGWASLAALLRRREAWFDRVLNQQLLLDIPPRVALGCNIAGVL